MSPKASVILCGFNQREYLVCAIESVLAQTRRDFELILIDNGSTDGSASLLVEYEGRPNVRIFAFQDNAPLTKRYNDAIRAAAGEFICFLNADDYLLPRKLERQIEAFKALGADYAMVYSPVKFINVLNGKEWICETIKSSGPILRDLFDDFFTKGYINFLGILVRRECLLRYPFREEVFFESEAIFFRLALRYKFYFLDSVDAVMREHLMNAGKAIDRNYENLAVLLEKLALEAEFPPALRPNLDRFRGRYAASLAWQSLRLTQDSSRARAYFKSAVARHPAQVLNIKVLLGFPLSFLPTPLLRAFNGALTGVMRHNENLVHRKDYGAG